VVTSGLPDVQEAVVFPLVVAPDVDVEVIGVFGVGVDVGDEVEGELHLAVLTVVVPVGVEDPQVVETFLQLELSIGVV